MADWNWKLLDDGTLQIYNGNNLYWEIDNCQAENEDELERIARKAIRDYIYLLNDVFDWDEEYDCCGNY